MMFLNICIEQKKMKIFHHCCTYLIHFNIIIFSWAIVNSLILSSCWYSLYFQEQDLPWSIIYALSNSMYDFNKYTQFSNQQGIQRLVYIKIVFNANEWQTRRYPCWLFQEEFQQCCDFLRPPPKTPSEKNVGKVKGRFYM